MTRDTVLALLHEHRAELSAFGLRRLAVFGSVARDEARAGSDVDILVEFDGPPTFDRYIELSFFLESLLPVPVDLLTAGSVRDVFRDAIEQDAVDVPQLSAVSD